MDTVWETKTYKPGILLADEVAAGRSLQASSSPGVSIQLMDVTNFTTDVQSGDEFEIHVVKRVGSTWVKIGGFWGLIDEVEGPVEDITVTTLPPLERFTKVERPRWSKEDYRSRYPADGFFDDLDRVQNEGVRVELWQR